MTGALNKVKEQIAEIAEVVNKFKSEAVQLRVIELLFQHLESGEPRVSEHSPSKRSRTKNSRKKVKKDSTQNGGEKPVKKSGRSSSKFGAQTALNRLLDEGYFKSKRTITDIVKHCSDHLATTLKASDFSGKLARAIRDKVLKRQKNANGQYEYFI